MGSRRKFTREFKLDAVQRLRAGEPAGLVARSLEVSRQELYRWSRDVDKFGERAFPGVGQKRAEETRIAELERVFHRDTAADTMSAIRHAAGENADPLPTLDNTMAVRDTVARLIADVLRRQGSSENRCGTGAPHETGQLRNSYCEELAF
jgi:transposase